jgi:hypothetical protein
MLPRVLAGLMAWDLLGPFPAAAQLSQNMREMLRRVYSPEFAVASGGRQDAISVGRWVENGQGNERVERNTNGGSDMPKNLPFKPGHVFAGDVYATFPGEKLGVRVENTVLITETGCENLTPGIPREVAAIEALMKKTDSSRDFGIRIVPSFLLDTRFPFHIA